MRRLRLERKLRALAEAERKLLALARQKKKLFEGQEQTEG